MIAPQREAQATWLAACGAWVGPPSMGRPIAGLRDCGLNSLPDNLEVLTTDRISSLLILFQLLLQSTYPQNYAQQSHRTWRAEGNFTQNEPQRLEKHWRKQHRLRAPRCRIPRGAAPGRAGPASGTNCLTKSQPGDLGSEIEITSTPF